MTVYDKPPELYSGLRLHQNEHTGGCSVRVLEALARLRADQISVYPPYSQTVAACAADLGLSDEQVVLVNGMDEGILALAVAYLQRRSDGAALSRSCCARRAESLARIQNDHCRPGQQTCGLHGFEPALDGKAERSRRPAQSAIAMRCTPVISPTWSTSTGSGQSTSSWLSISSTPAMPRTASWAICLWK